MRKDICVFIAVSLALAGCRHSSAPEEASAYKTMIVRQENRILTSEYSARLQGCEVVEVRPQVGGQIKRICIGEGDKVRKGQTLFVIDQVPYKAALAEAEANVRSAKARLATARLNLESSRALREKNVVHDFEVRTSENEYAEAEAGLAQAEAQLATARNNLSYTEVKSPVDGVAGMIAYRVGALVSSAISEPLVTVSDDSVIYAYFSLTESQVTGLIAEYGSLSAFLERMPAVSLRTSGGKDYPTKGRISAVSGIVSAGTGSVAMRADFTNRDGLLRAGGNATVIIPTERRGCIVIPQGATYELQSKTFAYKVVGGKAVSAPISVFRLNNGTEYVVESGLSEGDTIISEGAGLVKEGAAVTMSKGKEKGR
ncbi:MAG: efflux RND transporter periplasmic adaptor subunit [Prevotella sp.]